MKLTPAERKEKQAIELWQFVDVLRRADNAVEEEVVFWPPRKWRLDLVVNGKWAIEIEGLHGRHQHMGGFMKDMEKYNQVSLCGLRLLRVTRNQIANGDALDLLHRAGVRVNGK